MHVNSLNIEAKFANDPYVQLVCIFVCAEVATRGILQEKLFLDILPYSRKTPVLEYLFNKVFNNFFKQKDSSTYFFPCILQNF